MSENKRTVMAQVEDEYRGVKNIELQRLVLQSLRRNDGNRTATAEELGYKKGSRMSLYRIMKMPMIAEEFPIQIRDGQRSSRRR